CRRPQREGGPRADPTGAGPRARGADGGARATDCRAGALHVGPGRLSPASARRLEAIADHWDYRRERIDMSKPKTTTSQQPGTTRRGSGRPVSRAVPATIPAKGTEAVPTVAELAELERRAQKGDQQALAAIRTLFERFPALAAHFGDLAALAEAK